MYPWLSGTHSVDQVAPELRDPPASVSQVVELKMCNIAWLTSTVLLFAFCFLHDFSVVSSKFFLSQRAIRDNKR